jgi:hypothetical protein
MHDPALTDVASYVFTEAVLASTSLTLLDPLAALLLWARRAIGLYLTVLVLVTDAAANGYAVYRLPGATATGGIAQALVSVLALATLIMAPRVRRWMHPVPHTRT